MKKLLLLLVCFSSFVIQAQNFWTEVSTLNFVENLEIKQISIADINTVWLIAIPRTTGNSGIPMWAKSNDQGITWTTGSYNNNTKFSISSLSAVSSTTAYITTYYGSSSNTADGVWITQDSGQTWTHQNSALYNGSNSFTDFVHFFDSNNGVVVGDPVNNVFEIYTTTDGGINWIPVPSANIPPPIDPSEDGLVSCYDVSGNVLWFGTTFGRIYKSIDQGLHWTVSQSPIPDFGGDVNGYGYGIFSFKDINSGILSDENLNFWQTTDGGTTWNSYTTTGTPRNYRTCYVPQTTNTYFGIGPNFNGTVGGGCSYSTDGGLNWVDLNTTEIDPVNATSVKFQSGSVGYCAGTYVNSVSNTYVDGYAQNKFFRLTDPFLRLYGGLATNDFEKNKITISPNPTTELVRVSGAPFNKIIISDISGKTVYTENYSDLNESSINISKLENGVYFVGVYNKNGDSTVIKIIKN